MVAVGGAVTEVDDGKVERRPLLTPAGILMMNLGFFGIQFSFGLTQTAINPLFSLIGADAHSLPILNLAGPVTGLLIQPLIGAISDRTWSPRFGKRKPFVLAGALACVVILFLFPYVSAVWMAVVGLWLLDAGNNTAMEPYRALITDRLPKSQLARGFLTQSLFTGAGAVLANLSLFVFQQIISGATAAGVPYWAFACFWLGAVCILVTVLIAMARTKELPPTEEELAELRAQPKGLHHAIGDLVTAVKVMPVPMHKIGFVFLFQWYAMFIYWQFVALSIGESVFKTAPDQPGYDEAVGWSGLVNGAYNFFTMISALFLIRFCQSYGAKRVHAACLGLAAVSLVALANISNKYMTLIPMIGFGICWASMVGVPYLMVASMVPKERSGVYMGILNMMIVIPMLIETVTFGWIFENLLDGKATNAMMLAGGLLGVAGLAMLWVEDPDEAHDSPIMPLATHRHITVYNRVVVGTDGSPASQHAVAHAAGVANAADAHLVVVSAYNPKGGRAGPRQELRGEEAARSALRASVTQLTSERTRQIDQRIVAGDPAKALLDAAGANPDNLIVVGNRGLGAAEGQLLGSVPSDVVKNAVCDVLIVQTSDLPEKT